MIFYIVAAVVGTVSLTADMILRYMEKIKSFGMEERLHNIKGKTIPIEDFIPHNLTMLALFVMTVGVTGVPLKLLELNPFISFPVTVFCAALVNFFIMHFIYPLIYDRPIPKDEDISGCEAVCAEDMDEDNYGSIDVVWKGRTFSLPAYPANENVINKGDKVAVLYREDGVCFVETLDRLIDVLNE